jgi:uncharacterized protein
MKTILLLFVTLSAIVLAPMNPTRVLYITQSKGFKHQVLPESESVMKELGAKHGFEVELTQAAESALTPQALANTDVIVFYTTGELPLSAEQKTALLNFIKAGKGFVGIHSATDTFYQWPEYGEMINGYFDGHPWTQDTEVTIKVDDRTHPTTKHMPESIRLKEEIYQFKQFSPDKVKVLVSLDTSKTDMTKQGIKASSFPLVWYRQYGKGRVYYNALGHRPDVWQSDWYKTMMANTIKWAAGEIK